MIKSGLVGLIGRPNVGKSTLLNSIINKKIAIISNKPQTTRVNIKGIYNDQETQIVFLDTPGIHKPKDKLGSYLNQQSFSVLDNIDIILLLIDITKPLGRGDKFIIEKLKLYNKPVLLILNKIDKIPKEEILLKIDEYKNLYKFREIIPISALNQNDVNRLISVIKKYLNNNIKHYDNKDFTNLSLEFIIQELVREKILNLTNQEVPYAITCIVEGILNLKHITNISVIIIVDRDNLKKIIIGKNGQMLKKIGSRARMDIENYLNKKVYLRLFVKTIKDWRNQERKLKELGYN